MKSSKFTSHKVILVAVCIIVFITALIPRLMTYDFALPYIDHPDEPASYLKAQEWQGLFDLEGYHDGYPPAFLVVNLVVQLALGANGPSGLAPTVQILRILAAFASAAVSVFLVLSTYVLGRPLGKPNAIAAGLVAGSFWALSPLAIQYIYATPDPYVFLFSSVALFTAISGITAKRYSVWGLLSITAGLAAVFFKYSALPVITPGFLVLGYRWLTAKPVERPAAIRAFVGGIALVAASAFFLLFVYGATSLNTPGTSDVARESGFANLFNIQYFVGNLSASLELFGVPGTILVILSPILLLSIRRHSVIVGTNPYLRDTAYQLVVCYFLLITIPIITNTFNPGIFNGVRFLIPATLAAIVLVAATIAALTMLLFPEKSLISATIICFVSILFAIPALQQTSQLVANRRQPDSRVLLRTWADNNVEPGSVLVTVDNHKTFNPIWGGIPYHDWFDWVERTDLTIMTPQEWNEEAGVDYIAYPSDQWQTAISSLESSGFLLLGEFGGAGWRGPHIYLVRPEPLQHPHELTFSDQLALKGYEFDQLAQQIGESFILRLLWEALEQPPANYSVFLHLTPENDISPLAQADGAPAGANQQTAQWQSGDYYFSDPLTLTIPADLAARTYSVRVGLYDYLTGARLLVIESDSDSAVLFTFTVNEDGTITLGDVD